MARPEGVAAFPSAELSQSLERSLAMQRRMRTMRKESVVSHKEPLHLSSGRQHMAERGWLKKGETDKAENQGMHY